MKIIKLTCALLMSAWVSSANATLIFDFSFTDRANGGNHYVTGEIIGLSDNATGAASSVRIITHEGGFGIGEYVGAPWFNLFTVDNQNITFMNFVSFGVLNVSPVVTDSSFTLKYSLDSSSVGLSSYGSSISTGFFTFQDFQISLRSVDVPEPGTVILLSLGLAGLSFARYRRQS